VNIKQTIKTVLRRFGFDLVQYVDMPRHPFPVLPLVVADAVRRGEAPFIVQIGANDGKMADPVRELIADYGLPGLLVEPLPDLFASLQANYAGVPNIAFERCAIGTTDGAMTLYRFAPDAPVPAWAHGLASFDRGHLSGDKYGIGDVSRYVVPETVPCLTLATLLAKHGNPDVGLLQIDTEGFDCHIVRAALEGGLRPPIIHYEHENAAPADKVDCKRKLQAAGYRFIDIGRDTLAIRDVIS
jgi:FkbM family methyltransferase